MAAPRSPLREALAGAKRRAINAVLGVLPADMNVSLQYLRAHHRWPDLANPARLTEKIQALKLRGRYEAHAEWVDKIIAKERVAAILGREWITPTLWSGAVLPPREERTWPTPYLIKANHGSGWYLHVDSDADKDWARIERVTASWLRQRWHPHLIERQYARIVPQLLVEPRLGEGAVLPYDYKFWVFNGRAALVHVGMERLQGLKLATFDRDWNALPYTNNHLPRPEADPPKPPHFEVMRDAAERLAAPFPMARIDFYDLPDGPKFGEITLTPSSGMEHFTPDDWDARLGSMLDVSAFLKAPAAGKDAVSAQAAR
jgi:hypothetical protein